MNTDQDYLATVMPEWIDYNGHMNVAYYVLAFDGATDHFIARIGLDEAYRKEKNASIFVSEMKVNYRQELLEGDPIRIRTRVLDRDDRRIVLFHEMYHGKEGYLAATNEVMCVHVDLIGRKSCPYPESMVTRLDEIAAEQKGAGLQEDGLPPYIGRPVAVRKS